MHFAEMKDPVKEKVKRFALLARFGERPFFATIEEAVTAFLTSPHGQGACARSDRTRGQADHPPSPQPATGTSAGGC
jgi:hypothetical protein